MSKNIQCHSSIGVSPHKHKGCPTEELHQAYRPKSFRCFEQQLEHICSFLLLFIGNAVIFCIFFRWEFLHFGRCIKDAKYQDECSDIERIDDRIRHDSLGGDIADTDCREDKRKQISCQTSCITKETLNGIASPFCFSLTISPTIILKGCIAILMEVSRNIKDTRPKIMAALTLIPKLPAFGNRHMTHTATSAPTNR